VASEAGPRRERWTWQRHRSDFAATDQSDDPLFRPATTKAATVLAAVNDKPFGRPQEGPSLTAAARAGQTCLRSGRKNACGAVEQKNGVKREDHKALAFQAAIRERRNGRQARTKEQSEPRRSPMT
jgi:hypothetical protein